MRLLETMLLYLLIGAVVATVLALRSSGGLTAMAGRAVGGLIFWPLFLPALLGSGGSTSTPDLSAATGRRFLPRIRAAEQTLLEALGQVHGVAEEALAPEVIRVRALVGSMLVTEKRLDDMGRLLDSPEFDRSRALEVLRELSARGVEEDDPRVASVRARVRNIEHLIGMKTRALEDLERILFKIEEMSSRIRLLRFAGGPESELLDLIKEISGTVADVTDTLLHASVRDDPHSRQN